MAKKTPAHCVKTTQATVSGSPYGPRINESFSLMIIIYCRLSNNLSRVTDYYLAYTCLTKYTNGSVIRLINGRRL